MPGVRITTGATAGPSSPNRAPSATYFVVGLAERGPIDAAVKVTTLAAYEKVFGGRPNFGALYDDLRVFFEEGGAQAYVARVVGPAATIGALGTPLVDRAGTPKPTLQITANGPGAWSSRLSVQVLNGSVDDTFTLRIRFDGDIVETWANLRSPAEAASRMAKSLWVKVTNLSSTSVAPQNNPAVVAATSLTAGTDDRININTTSMLAALPRFTRNLGDGAVAIPGVGDGGHAGLIAHADTYYRTAILASSRATPPDELIALASSLDAPRAGLFAPWVQVPDGFGGTRALSPEGYVAAVRARAHQQVGPWRAAAAEIARFRYVVAPDELYDEDTAQQLNDGKVSAIVANELYGWRSVSEDTDNWYLLTGADTLNRVTHEALSQTRGTVFETIDAKGHLLASIAGRLEGIVKPITDLGGLYPWIDETTGEQMDPGYKITVDESNNPRSSVAQNRINIDVGVRISPSAELVFMSITKAGVEVRL